MRDASGKLFKTTNFIFCLFGVIDTYNYNYP